MSLMKNVKSYHLYLSHINFVCLGTGSVGGSSAKEYVESLHQNSRATLLYGKNNVRVQPVRLQITFWPTSYYKRKLYFRLYVFFMYVHRFVCQLWTELK